MDPIIALKKRYSTKVFDPTKKISPEIMEKVESMLQLSASSTNAQPWHFVIATTDEGKKKIAKATQGFYIFNEGKVLNASAVVVFASKVDVNEEYLLKVLDKEDKDGRFKEVENKNNQHGGRLYFANMHKYDLKDQQHWAEKQVYLNLGSFLLGVAELGLDAIPMEGLELKVLDEELGLRKMGFTASVVVPIGYHAEDDFNAKLPKSRLSKDEIITRI
jgi:nitroreductase/dihydropteridine reductase